MQEGTSTGRKIIFFGAALFNSLVAGAAFAIWIDYKPANMSASFYTEKMQHAIRVFTIPLPILVVLGVVFAIGALIVARKERTSALLFGLATVCILVVALVTAFGNIPINNQIITWNANQPPDNWKALADSWWTFQSIRVVAAVIGTSSIVIAFLSRLERPAS